MSSRQRVIEALTHRQPDAVPIDFGSTAVTGMHCSCVAALREHYGLTKELVKVDEPYQMLGRIEEDLKQAMGLDVEGVPAPKTLFGFPNEKWKSWRAPWGDTYLVSQHFKTTKDPNGDLLIYPEGDTGAPPSGRLPKTGYFFDTIIRQEPIDEQAMDPAENLEEFGPVDDATLLQLKAWAEQAAATGRAVVAGLPGTALGDIALVPAPFLKHPRGVRDVAEWYMAIATHPDYLHEIFACQVEVALLNLPKLYAAMGENVNAVFLCGTDFGTQQSTFCSAQTYRELYKPYYRRMTDWIHQHTGWKVFKHSCGAIASLMDELIDTGFDIINPVQCSAAGMEAGHLKKTYGDRITFWGGGIDTQKVLPFGSPKQVRRQVFDRCRTFGAGGGFIFNAVHNVQAKTPVDNIVAMIDAVRDFSARG